MAIDAIDLGTTANDGTGDTLRDAGTKINANFAELDSLKAPKASPTFTGTPVAPTAAGGTNTTQIATTAFVKAAVDALVASAPGALDTLDELSAALGDDANFAATMTTALAGKQPLDADLTALAALSTTSFGRSFLELANAAAARTLLGIDRGTSFPGSPATGDIFYRSDRNIEYFYDGTRWLSTQLFTDKAGAAAQTAGTDYHFPIPWQNQYDIYLEQAQILTLQTVGSTATNYYSFQLKKYDGTTVDTVGSAMDNQNQTLSAWYSPTPQSLGVVADLTSNEKVLYVTTTRTGTATSHNYMSIAYRLVG